MSSLKVELVAADRKVWEGEASLVRARSIEGDLGIMPGHQPLLAVLVGGDVIIESDCGRKDAQIDEGFLSVANDVVTIVAQSVSTGDSKRAS